MSEKAKYKREENNKYSYEEVCSILKSNGYDWQDKEYINAKQNLIIKDKEGYIYETNMSNFNMGKRPIPVSIHNKYSIHNINKYIENNKLNVKLISSEYLGSTKPLGFICGECGEEYSCSWGKFSSRHKVLCNSCSLINKGNKRLHDIEFIRSEFIKEGYTPLFNEYKGCEEKLTIKDEHGYVYETIYRSLKSGCRPQPFSVHNPYTIKNIETYIKNTNADSLLKSDVWQGNDINMEFKCSCGNIFERTWCSFVASDYKVCDSCLADVRKTRKHDIDFVRDEFIRKGYAPLFDEYNNSGDKLKFMTQDGYTALTTYDTLITMKEPSIIHITNPYTIENINKMSQLEKWDSKMISKEWIGNGSEYDFECICGNTYTMSWDIFQARKNKVCRACASSISKREFKVNSYLEDKNINIVREKRFDDCRYKNPLPFDFYLPHLNICIEVDGEQHFEPVNFGGMSNNKALENYLKLKINDRIKTDYCNSNGIKLIRIPYWEFENDGYIETLNREL